MQKCLGSLYCSSSCLNKRLRVQLQAFLAASLKNDEELLGWFNERLVWNDPAVVTEMLKNGLFVRIFAPQVLTHCKLGALSHAVFQRHKCSCASAPATREA